jgi:hypothetical protein
MDGSIKVIATLILAFSVAAFFLPDSAQLNKSNVTAPASNVTRGFYPISNVSRSFPVSRYNKFPGGAGEAAIGQRVTSGDRNTGEVTG